MLFIWLLCLFVVFQDLQPPVDELSMYLVCFVDSKLYAIFEVLNCAFLLGNPIDHSCHCVLQKLFFPISDWHPLKVGI